MISKKATLDSSKLDIIIQKKGILRKENTQTKNDFIYCRKTWKKNINSLLDEWTKWKKQSYQKWSIRENYNYRDPKIRTWKSLELKDEYVVKVENSEKDGFFSLDQTNGKLSKSRNSSRWVKNNERK